MIILDVETTGTNPEKHSIVSIGAIDFNNPTNRFSIECSAFPGAHLEEEAMKIIGKSEEDVFNPSLPSEAEAVKAFLKWMEDIEDHTIAGQNCYFDLEFIFSAGHRAHLNISLPKRIVDLHSVMWAHIISNGEVPPIDRAHKKSMINSDYITDYVGIPREGAPHIGINGAMWEAESFSRIFYSKGLLEEFANYKIPWV